MLHLDPPRGLSLGGECGSLAGIDERSIEDRLRDAALGRHHLLERIVETVVDGRDRHEDRWPDFGQIVHQRLGARQPDRRTGADHEVQFNRLPKRVGPRQERCGAVVRVDVEHVGEHVDVAGDVAVGQHHTLRLAGCPGGIDEARQILR